VRQFCEAVLKFLESEYSDAYQFSIEYHSELDHDKDTVNLIIEMNSRYKTIIGYDAMFFIYGWYRSGVYMEERSQYRWQKELIDLIEGS
jgi:hypothetical protein